MSVDEGQSSHHWTKKCTLNSSLPVRMIQAFAEKTGIRLVSRQPVAAFDEFMRKWLPLSRVCFRAVMNSSSARASFTRPGRLNALLLTEAHPLHNAVKKCSDEEKTVVYVAKILSCEETLVTMCRVLSGTTRVGDRLYVVEKKKTNDGTINEK